MYKISEEMLTQVQVFPTLSSSVSGSVAVDMSNYSRALVKTILHKLPDAKGEGVATVSVYENVGTGATGTIITASTVTASLTSASNVEIYTEVRNRQLSEDKRYVYARITLPTNTTIACTIDRKNTRFLPN